MPALDQDVDALERWTTRSVSDGSVTARRYIWHTMVACRSLKWRKAIRKGRGTAAHTHKGYRCPRTTGQPSAYRSLDHRRSCRSLDLPPFQQGGVATHIFWPKVTGASVYACMHCIGPVTRRALFVPCYVSLVWVSCLLLAWTALV